jgi:hypothetical protein
MDLAAISRATPRFHDYGPGGCQPKSWVIEVSDDETNWTEIDRKVDNDELDDVHVIRTFSVEKSIEARFIRMRQIDTNHGGWDQFALCAFELFGTLTE